MHMHTAEVCICILPRYASLEKQLELLQVQVQKEYFEVTSCVGLQSGFEADGTTLKTKRLIIEACWLCHICAYSDPLLVPEHHPCHCEFGTDTYQTTNHSIVLGLSSYAYAYCRGMYMHTTEVCIIREAT